MGCFYSKTDDFGEKYDMSPIKHLPVIFVNGVPGAGNQTVAQTISNITGYTMVRPGELIRDEATKDTARGRMIGDKLSAQEDIPEQLTVNLIKEAMLAKRDAKGFILVGFPKNPRMSNMFNRQVKWPEKVVALEVDNERKATTDDGIKCQYTIEFEADLFPTLDRKLLEKKSLEVLRRNSLPAMKEVAATRLKNKLSELGRPESEINAARSIVRQAAFKVKSVHKRFGGHVVTVDSSGNPSSLASVLKEILADTLEGKATEKTSDMGPVLIDSTQDIRESPCPAMRPGIGDTNLEIEIKEQEM